MLIPILGNVISLLNRIGKNGDTTSTIHGKVGQSSDATGTGSTLFSRIGDLKTQVGTTSDAASSTGSVNAKLANLQNTQRQIGMTKQTGTTTSATAVTILSLSGAGRLSLLSLSVSGGSSPSSYITSVKADGVEICSSFVSGGISLGGTTTTEAAQTPPWNLNSYTREWDVRFKSSLVIQGYVTGGATLTVNAYCEM